MQCAKVFLVVIVVFSSATFSSAGTWTTYGLQEMLPWEPGGGVVTATGRSYLTAVDFGGNGMVFNGVAFEPGLANAGTNWGFPATGLNGSFAGPGNDNFVGWDGVMLINTWRWPSDPLFGSLDQYIDFSGLSLNTNYTLDVYFSGTTTGDPFMHVGSDQFHWTGNPAMIYWGHYAQYTFNSGTSTTLQLAFRGRDSSTTRISGFDLWTSVPEPSSLVLLTAAVAGVIVIARRRRCTERSDESTIPASAV